MSTETSIVRHTGNPLPLQDFAKTAAYPFELKNNGQTIPVYAYLTPYTPDELKHVLSKDVAGYRREKRDVEIVREDRQIYADLLDAHFVKLGNASGSPEQQRAYLDRYPELKPSIVEFTFGGLQLARNEKTDVPAFLDISLELSSSVKCFQDIYDPETDKTVRIDFAHNHKHPTEGQFRAYRSARRNKFLNTKSLWTVTEQHGTLENLYDQVITSVTGACVNEARCDDSNKAVWISYIPLWHKLLVVDQIFGELVEKNA